MADALISYPFTEDGLKSALEALGTSADAVARNLDAMDFTGCRSEAQTCPIAHYVLASIPDAKTVRVEFGVVEVADEFGRKITVAQPDPVGDFVEYFDAGGMPQLEVPDASS